MRVSYIIVEETESLIVKEGIYTFEEFETVAKIAASATTPFEPSNIVITAYFCAETESNTRSDLQSTIQANLELHQKGDWGFMDWIGNVMCNTDDEFAQLTLQEIEKTLH